MVGNKGLEPLRYKHQNLDLACLPIPPIPHVWRPSSSAIRIFLYNDETKNYKFLSLQATYKLTGTY